MEENQSLILPLGDKGKVFPHIRNISINRRKESVLEAVGLENGESQANQVIHEFYEYKNFKVVAGKPGKEAAPDYKGKLGHNYNDMTPTLLVDGKKHPNNFGFDDIFGMLSKISKKSYIALELLGCILFRAAYMLDHKKDENGHWRINLPETTVSIIESKAAEVEGMPIRVLIYLIELIALNEDIKYYTLGRNDDFKDAIGRRNNLLTYCNLIGVLLERISFSKFAGSFARLPVGISALTQKDTFKVFPLLKPEGLE